MKDRNNNMFMPFPNKGFMPNMGVPTMPMELENRVNSLERMVKRLDARVSILVGNSGMYSGGYNTSIPDNYTQNIYPNAMHMM